MKKLFTLLAIFMAFSGCKKKQDESQIEESDSIQFEVVCTGCTINYTDDAGNLANKSNVQVSFIKNYPIARDITVNVTHNTSYTFKLTINGTQVMSRTYTNSAKFDYEAKTRKLNTGSTSYEYPTAGGSGSSTTGGSGSGGCGTYSGKSLYIGPKGGCYYINGSGNKTYVDRGKCKC